MQFDDQMLRYFGSTDVTTLTEAAIAAGIEKMRVDLGLEQDRARRFALWAMLDMFGSAPDLDVAFKNEEDREAARNLMDISAAGVEADRD